MHIGHQNLMALRNCLLHVVIVVTDMMWQARSVLRSQLLEPTNDVDLTFTALLSGRSVTTARERTPHYHASVMTDLSLLQG